MLGSAEGWMMHPVFSHLSPRPCTRLSRDAGTAALLLRKVMFDEVCRDKRRGFVGRGEGGRG